MTILHLHKSFSKVIGCALITWISLCRQFLCHLFEGERPKTVEQHSLAFIPIHYLLLRYFSLSIRFQFINFTSLLGIFAYIYVYIYPNLLKISNFESKKHWSKITKIKEVAVFLLLTFYPLDVWVGIHLSSVSIFRNLL
jgi:hypothetical protein